MSTSDSAPNYASGGDASRGDPSSGMGAGTARGTFGLQRLPGQGAAQALNHVLRQQHWAAERLKPFAGRSVEFRAAPLPPLRLVVREDGLVEAWDGGDAGAANADLTVILKPGALPHLLRQDDAARQKLMREIELSGPADLAHVVQDLARDLRWDFEEDLSRVFGDALAHRMAETGRKLFAFQQEATDRLLRNVAEYWTEENPRLVSRAQLESFTSQVSQLEADLQRLEARASRLQGP